MDLRQHIATNGLKLSMEGNFGLPVELIAPDGTEIKTNEIGETLKGQILYDADMIEAESGDPIVVKETRVSLRITALSRVPISGEKWGIRIPLNPALPTVLTTMELDSDKAMQSGASMGFITLFPKDTEQI